MRRKQQCQSLDGRGTQRSERFAWEDHTNSDFAARAAPHRPMPRALFRSAEPITFSRAIWYGSLELALFLGFRLPIVRQMANWCWIVACFCTGTAGMIDFSMALFRNRRLGVGLTDRLANSPPLHVCFMPRLLVRVDRSLRKQIGTTAGWRDTVSYERVDWLAKLPTIRVPHPILRRSPY